MIVSGRETVRIFQRRVLAAGLEVIDAQVVCNAVEPGRKGGAGVRITAHCFQCVNEYVMGDILGILVVADNTVDIVSDGRRMALVQLGECVWVALGSPHD